MTAKLLSDQEKRHHELHHDPNNKKLQESNIEQLIQKTKHDLSYVNNAMKVQNNQEKLKER